ncbi:hypothetical protein GCM10020219_086660 [Nonomuraea dietziae]
MQVVDVGDARRLQQVLAHLGQVDAPGRGLEQDVDGLPEQLPGARQDQQRDDDRDERVGGDPSGELDDDRAGEHRHRAEQVAQHLQVGALEVEALVLAVAQQPQPEPVGHQADRGGDHHDRAADRLGVGEAPYGLDEDVAAQPEQQHRVDGGGEDLGPLVAERPARAGGLARDPDREQGEGDARAVGGHVTRVGEQGEAS